MVRKFWLFFSFTYSTLSCFAAIDIIFDYSYDTGNYFGDEQRYIMEQVAYVFESRMDGTSFTGTRPNEDVGVTGVTAKLNFDNPTTDTNIRPLIGSTTSDGNVIGRPDELVIFLGARSHGFSSSNVLASAAQTGTYWSWTSASDKDAWLAVKNAKNTSSLYQPIAGVSQVNTAHSFYFDTDLTTHADAEASGKYDFYTIMVHEIGHIMGFNTHNAWNANLSGSDWNGPEAKKQYSLQSPPNGEAVPLVSSTNPHWNLDLNYGKVNCGCHPSMLPEVNFNYRASFSDLDFALLKDIGYSISDAPTGTNIGGTYTVTRNGSNANGSYSITGTYDIPVSMSYNDWLTGGNGGNGSGGFVSSGSAAPEPAYIFTLLGGALAFISSRKNFGKIKYLLKLT